MTDFISQVFISPVNVVAPGSSPVLLSPVNVVPSSFAASTLRSNLFQVEPAVDTSIPVSGLCWPLPAR